MLAVTRRWTSRDSDAHHRKIGAATITGVIEYSGPTHAPEFLYPEIVRQGRARRRARSANASWLAPNHYVPHIDRLIVTIQLWVVQAGGNVIVIDTGVGNRKPRAHARMDMLNTLVMPWLEAVGAGPEQVTHVVMTHLHTDHVGWNTDLAGRAMGADVSERALSDAAGRIRLLEGRIRQGRHRGAGGSFADSVLPVLEAGLVDFIDRQPGGRGLPGGRAGRRATRPGLLPSACARAAKKACSPPT